MGQPCPAGALGRGQDPRATGFSAKLAITNTMGLPTSSSLWDPQTAAACAWVRDTPTVTSCTFRLQAIGVKVHPLLTLGAAHQEPRDGLSREEGIGLCDLEETGHLSGGWGRPGCWATLGLGHRHHDLCSDNARIRGTRGPSSALGCKESVVFA